MSERPKAELVTIHCAYCNREFKKLASVIRTDAQRGKKIHYCSVQCFKDTFLWKKGFGIYKKKGL